MALTFSRIHTFGARVKPPGCACRSGLFRMSKHPVRNGVDALSARRAPRRMSDDVGACRSLDAASK
ncbi:hypothetical protein DP43_4633 [Burkholderia pseudomallei]|nr:hypothetical protein DP43_4633 [Burkholderia pseudomallei]